MATKCHNTIISVWICFLIANLDIVSHGCVQGLQIIDRSKFTPAPRGTIKTIEVPKDDDLIDCIDIYKQPAFDDPLMKDIQMKPSPDTFLAFNKMIESRLKIIQNWHKYGKCPKGTVPIRRAWKNEDKIFDRKPVNFSTHEHAVAFVPTSTYQGAGAAFNVWNPHVQIGANEFSLSQMWLISRNGQPTQNSLEAGWTVYPALFGDSKTRLFTFWTRDNYQQTLCYNYQCSGFVHTSDDITLGSPIEPISVYGRNQYEVFIALSKDRRTGNWWLQVQYTEVGYFRAEVFTTLRFGADDVEFGGEVVNRNIGNRHTGTKMGSGHFAREGYGKASYVRQVMVWDRLGDLVDASLTPLATHPNCYDVIIGPYTSYRHLKSHFYFGGPGYSPTCH